VAALIFWGMVVAFIVTMLLRALVSPFAHAKRHQD
jgi:hypothetical protein